LILFQGLQGKKVEGMTGPVLQERFQHRQIINKGLAAGGGGGNQHVPACPDGRQGLGLVAIEPGDPLALQGRGQLWRQTCVFRSIVRRHFRQVAVMTYDIAVFRGFLQLLDEIF